MQITNPDNLTLSIISITICLISSFFDGIRDNNVIRKTFVPWWPWHIVKWTSFFPPLVFLIVYFTPVAWWSVIAILAYFLWTLDYKISLTKFRT